MRDAQSLHEGWRYMISRKFARKFDGSVRPLDECQSANVAGGLPFGVLRGTMARCR
jgi:hypothetical protein